MIEPRLPPERWQKIAAALAALVVAIGVAYAAVTGDDGGSKPTPTATPTPTPTTVQLGGQGEKKIELPPAAQVIARDQAQEDEAGQTDRSESDLRAPDKQPDAGELEDGNQAAPVAQPPIPKDIPQAAPRGPPGCHTAFVRNQSGRNGAKIALGVIHWTGSRNIAHSAADVLANVRWFDQSASQASSTYITDDDGNCYYTVPETAKAWTQAGANPWSLSVEITNPGVLPLFNGAAGRNRVLELMRRWHKLWGLPYRRAHVNGSCVPTRSGFLAHRDLGPCGGGHPDVGPSPATVDGLIRDAARGTQAATVSILLAGEKKNVACLQSQRAVARRHGGWTKVADLHLRKARTCKAGLEKSVRFYKAHPTPNRTTRAARRIYIGKVIAG